MYSAKISFDIPGVGVALQAHRVHVFKRVFLEITTIYGKPLLSYISYYGQGPTMLPNWATYDERMAAWLERWRKHRNGEWVRKRARTHEWQMVGPLVHVRPDSIVDLRIRSRAAMSIRIGVPRCKDRERVGREVEFVMRLCDKYDDMLPLRLQAGLKEALSDPSRSPLLRPTAGFGARLWKPSEDPAPGQIRGPLSSTAGCRTYRVHPDEGELYYQPSA